MLLQTKPGRCRHAIRRMQQRPRATGERPRAAQPGAHLLRGLHGPLRGVRGLRGVRSVLLRGVRRVVAGLHAQVLGAGVVVRVHQRPVVRVRVVVVPVGLLLHAQGGPVTCWGLKACPYHVPAHCILH